MTTAVKYVGSALLLYILSLVPLGAQQAPGGVRGAKVWMQTRQQSDGSYRWVDQAGSPVGTASGTAYRLNHHSALYLDGHTDEYTLPLDTTITAISLFGVYQPTGKEQEQSLWSVEGDQSVAMVATSHRLADLSTHQYSGYRNPTYQPSLYSYVRRQQPDSAVGNLTLRMGRKPQAQVLPVESFSGLLPEIVIYDRPLSLQERRQVESYLALKYGVSLDQTWGTSYFNARGETIWNVRENGGYASRVAGIGRDDASGLYQAVSGSSLTPNLLELSVVQHIPDNSFLIWGDNDRPLTLTKAQGQPSMLDRRWKVSTFGGLATATATLTLDYLQLEDRIAPDHRFWLMVDTTGAGTFAVENTVYYPGDNVQPAPGFVRFSDVRWANGVTFTLFEAPELFACVDIEKPLCGGTSGGRMHVAVRGGKAPYILKLVENTSRQPFYRPQVASGIYTFEGVSVGEYRLQVEDSEGRTYEEALSIDHANGPVLTLAPSYTVTDGVPVTLHAVEEASASLYSYTWSSKAGIISRNSSVTLGDAGCYRVAVSDENGCTSKAKFEVNAYQHSPFSSVVLYPNPSTDGHFYMRISLERPAAVDVFIHDLSGRLIRQESLSGKESFYRYSGQLSRKGSYLIILRSEGQQVERKLIVE